ncbi:PREDICTED: probable mannan synthase 11 [Tarenaya hassleriana]|uniref:probable mannan synthase 11 n=1 Tax=Tarenaya hassleriana TaxID=28532 RepID=UPI00053C1A1C|nr:PREDICTED: probable mannan synthase 11 [Tarenaya hassleriana]
MSPLLKPFAFLFDSSLALLSPLFHGWSSNAGSSELESNAEISIGFIWNQTRSFVILPLFEFLVTLCLVLSLAVFMESIYMSIVVIFVKLFNRKPEKVYKWEALKEDAELGHSNHPMVLVQIPMYNEKEVFQLSIGAACMLKWPSDRLIVQVLDDSTDPTIKEMVNVECGKWASKGINIKCEIRDSRSGYKAGALRQGMRHNYVKQCDYVAIFDADFQPEPDFLERSIPFLVHNSDVALVQARWKFVNANECLMTRMQEMSLNYHFMAEQESGSTRHAFFGFNGTAGVWRIAAMNDAGGWKDRTTVEDMDLAVRAGLRGWKFVFVNDLTVKSELPCKFKAFRFQQHRWSCGPANLFRKMTMEIVHNKRVTWWKKCYVIYSFFFVRKVVVHIFTFFFYCIILPTSVFFPQVHIPTWATVYAPSVISISNAIATPRSFYLVVFWILFENVNAMHRSKGSFIGMLEGGRVNEWVVTEKLGDALKTKLLPQVVTRPRFEMWERVNMKEFIVGIYIMGCACYDFIFGKTWLSLYLFMQSIAFLVCGIGYVGK